MNTENLKITSTFFYVLSFLAIVYQLIITETFTDIACVLIVFFSNIVAIYYCFNKKYFFEYPISLFSIFISSMMISGGALYLKSIELSLITEHLKLPLSTIIVVSLFNLTMIMAHIIYRNSFSLNNIKTAFNNFFSKHNFLEIKNLKFLYVLAIIGFSAQAFYYDFNVVMEEQTQSYKEEGGPSLTKDILGVFKVFYYTPIIILFSHFLYKIPYDNKTKWFFFIFLLMSMFFAISENARSLVYDIFAFSVILYIFLFLLGIIKMNRSFYITFILFVLLIGPATNFFEKISRTFLLERGTRTVQTPLENFNSFVTNFGSVDVEENYQDAMSASQLYKSISLDYYDNTLYNRINFLLLNDTFYYISRNLEKMDKRELVKIQLGRFLSIVPQPIINLFTDDFDKRDYLSSSMGSHIYYAFDPVVYGLHAASGSMIMTFYMFVGYWCFPLFLLFCLPVFVLFDSFYSKKFLIISPIILLIFFRTTDGIVNFFAVADLGHCFRLVLRIIPQTMIFYFIVAQLFLFFEKKEM